jgi:uncharacterized membrane protein YqhA
MLGKLLAQSRYLIIIAVVGSLLASVLVTVFAGWSIVRIVFAILRHGLNAEDISQHVAVGAIELIELFLLGTVLYVIALGIYQLFIEQDIHLPAWLEIHTLDNLKERLLSTVLLMLAVSFLGFAVTWDGSPNILALGGATGLVIAGLAYTLSLAGKRRSQMQAQGAKTAERPEE